MTAFRSSSPDVAIVGAGLAGLTAAALIARAGRSVVVQERLGPVGGNARSAIVDGFVFNRGPHALYRGGAAERVLTSLGVQLSGGAPPPAGRVVFDGVSAVAPAGPVSLLRCGALGSRDKVELARLMARLPRLEPASHADETAATWIERSVSRERPARLLAGLIRLTSYVSRPDELSAEVAIDQLQRALGAGVLYLDGGWQSIVDQLRAAVGAGVMTDTACAELPEARAVIVATGGPCGAQALLGRSFDVGPPAEVSVIDYGLARQPRHDFVIGADTPFYFSHHSAAADLAPAGSYHAVAMQYLGSDDEPDPEAIDAFAGHAGVNADDAIATRRLHRLTAVSSITTADQGGLAGRPGVADTGEPNVFMAGDWVGPEGHLADAVVASAEAAAVKALALLDPAVRP